MEFQKIAEQNSYNEVLKATSAFRNHSTDLQGIISYLQNNGVEIEHSILPAVTEFDENVFQGTVINHNRRVLEFFIDVNNPEESEIDDVTEQLGPKDPAHPQSDIKDLITMSLVYFDEENKTIN